MLSSSSMAAFSSPPSTASERIGNPKTSSRTVVCQKLGPVPSPITISVSPSRALQVAFPLAASISILLCSTPINAGVLSGFPGLESVPGPQLPQIDFLNKWNDENQKKYAEFDSRFKSTTVLKELLEKTKLNKERNEKAIKDKYCLRGAEWGVGVCSTEGMSQEERDQFIAMLKKNSGGE